MDIITHDDIVNLNLSPEVCFEWIKTMIAKKKDTVLMPKISMKSENHVFYNTMPSILPFCNVAGVKVVNRYPDRTPTLDSQILLYDLKTGDCMALLDGNYITAMRTGAVAAYSIELLSRKEFTIIGMIGLGNTARAAYKFLLMRYPHKKLIVKLKEYKDQHIKFIEDFSSTCVKFEVCHDYEEVIRDSDVIISSVTYASKNFCKDDCYKEGCLVVPIHTRGFQNCDLFFDKIFADDAGHVQSFENFNKFHEFAEFSDVVLNKHLGRTNDRERILVYNIGISIHDIYFAYQIWKIMQQKGCQKKCYLNHLKEKFWIV